MNMEQSTAQAGTIYLLAIRGALAPPTLDAARVLHNETAGAPASVAAARALGDLSHMVYVPIDHAGTAAGEFLILDQWISLDGLNQFFANAQVQEQAGRIFTERDPGIWAPAEGFLSYHCPAPTGHNERHVGIVRGSVATRSAAQATHNALMNSLLMKARVAGSVAHEAFFQLAAPGEPETLEFFAVDVWYDREGMARHYEDPAFRSGFGELFVAAPSTSIWTHPAGEWVEW